MHQHSIRKAAVILLLASTATAADKLPWVENDYSGAQAEAKSRRLPVLAEIWAPW